MILFSILIPSIPSRLTGLGSLYTHLQNLVDKAGVSKEVEILSFLDNKQRSIGYKRDGLVQLARGEFCAQVDDDDVVYDNYVSEIVSAIKAHRDADLIVFTEHVTINGGNPFELRFGVEYKENEQCHYDSKNVWQNITRQPFQCCVWKTAIAQSERFPDVSCGEDWDWCKRVIPKVKVQHRIEKVLMRYCFSDAVSEWKTASDVRGTTPT